VQLKLEQFNDWIAELIAHRIKKHTPVIDLPQPPELFFDYWKKEHLIFVHCGQCDFTSKLTGYDPGTPEEGYRETIIIHELVRLDGFKFLKKKDFWDHFVIASLLQS
jgi:hypothetical protein